MNKLIFVPIPLAEESPYSLIRRVTLFHGFHTIGQFSSHCVGESAVQHIAVTQSSAIAQFLAEEAGTYAPAVLSGFYKTVNRAQTMNLLVSGIEIPSIYLRLRSFVYCDGCLEEGWQRQIQDIKLAEFCPYHQKKYLAHCPACGGDFKWWHALHGKCHYCGVVLKCTPCTAQDCRHEQYLVQSLKTHDQAYLDKVMRIARNLGSVMQKKPTAPEASRCQINEAAMLIANNDAHGILQHLSALHSIYPDIDKSWIAARFSGFKSPEVNEAINAFMKRTSFSQDSIQSDTPFLLTAGQARRKMQAEGLRFASISRICQSVNATRKFFTNDDIFALSLALEEYHAKSAGRLPIAQSEMWTTKEVARRLNVKPNVVQTYSRDGLLPFYCGKKGRKFFLPADVDCLLDRLQPPHYIAATCGVKVIKIRKAILESQVEPSYNAELHWSYWLFTSEDIQSIKLTLAHKKSRATEAFPLILPNLPADPVFFAKFLSYAQTAKSLRIEKAAVHELIKWHYLKHCYISVKKIYIPKTEIQKFKQKYLNSKTTSKILKISVNRLADVLQFFGIQPLIFPATTQSRTTAIYRKKEISKFAIHLSTEKPTENQNYLSITIAAKRAQVSEHTLRALAYRNVLSHVAGKSSFYFRPSVLDLFRKKFSIIETMLAPMGFPLRPTPRLIEKLYKYDTKKIPPRTNTAEFYRSSADILSYLNSETPIDPPILTKIKRAAHFFRPKVPTLPPDCILLSVALEQFRISYNDFYDTFLKKGFVSLIRHEREKYLNRKDFDKCQHILASHITCAMADRLVFNNSGTSRCLIRRSILIGEHLSNFIAKPLIQRDMISHYLINHPVSSYLKLK
ncbi:DNA-binding transcriptional MerR regulator [Pseudomonas frederiksbergensis]|uniref:helix-turn-helix domain-containing protein n=1 Tax=Pseudomonas frederiksbergensis TaxID=104087 RepID=UPI003D23603E